MAPQLVQILLGNPVLCLIFSRLSISARGLQASPRGEIYLEVVVGVGTRKMGCDVGKEGIRACAVAGEVLREWNTDWSAVKDGGSAPNRRFFRGDAEKCSGSIVIEGFYMEMWWDICMIRACYCLEICMNYPKLWENDILYYTPKSGSSDSIYIGTNLGFMIRIWVTLSRHGEDSETMSDTLHVNII